MSGLADRLPGRARLPRLPRLRPEAPARPLHVDGRPSPRERVYGLGTIFAKSVRDSRRGILGAGLGLGLLVFFTASQVLVEFGTAAARAQLAALPGQLPPMFRGLLGEPINVGTLGGFLSWRTLNFMALIVGAWSIVALSGTLAGEAARGSLDLVVATPRPRISVAAQKAAGHVAAVAVAMGILALFLWAAAAAFGTLPGDGIALGDALSHAAWMGLMGIVPGSLAWAVAPAMGRGASRGIAVVVMIASFTVHGFRETVPLFASLDAVSYFGLTAGHRPIAGVSDAASLAVVGAVAVLLLVIGAVLFQGRDIGSARASAIVLPRLPFGLGGPLARAFADRFGVATWWGLGLGAFGLVYALQADAFAESLNAVPQMREMIQRFFPNVDITSTGGILQLVFFGFGTLLAAIAAAMVAGGWASDESEGRLEMVLSTPRSRLGWALRSGSGAMLGVAWFGILTGALLAFGTVLQGDDPGLPFAGALVLALYAAALTGVGIAVGGLVRPGLAAAVAGGLGLAFYLLDTLGSAIGLPDALLELSLTQHLGEPMAGTFDPVGMAACAAIAAAGAALGAVGLARRDIAR